MKRDDLKTAVRNATRESEFTKWRLANGMPEHSGNMTKAQWQVAYDALILNQETGTVTPATAPAVPAETPATQETAEPMESPVTDPLADLAPFISETALAPIRDEIKAAEDRAKAAEDRAKAAEDRAKAQPVPASGTAAPAPAAASPAAFVPPVVNMVAERPLSDIIKGAKSDVPVVVCDYADAPAIDPNFIPPAELVRVAVWMNANRNIALFGDRGTGKSSLVRYLAAITNRPYFEISFHSETSHSDLFGFEGPATDGGTAWVPGDLLKAMTTPYALIDLSEIANGRPELLMGLNAILETAGRQIFAGGRVYKVAEGVQFFATTNDNGTGENAHKFAGVRPMNEATRSRFVWVSLELPSKAQLAKVLAKQTAAPREACDMVAELECKLRDQVKAGECEATFGLRSLVSWVMATKLGLPSRDALDDAALNSATAEDAGVWQNESVANFDHPRFEAICRGEMPVETRDGFTAVE